MDVVDTQLHIGPSVETTLAQMDAVGIASVLIEEYWFWEHTENYVENKPGFALPNGAWRALFPMAQQASLKYPDRFGFYVRLDRRDPDLANVVRTIAATPGAYGFRMLATNTPADTAAFIEGAFDETFALAESAGQPMCLFIPGNVHHLPRYLKKFPKLNFIIDHWGFGMGHNPSGVSDAELKRTMHTDYFGEIAKVAEYPNVALKLSHANMFFNAPDYPYEPIRPHLRKAIQAFGAERLLWATDQTVTHPRIAWADLLHYLRNDPELSHDEKVKILGANARRIFKWPAPSA